MKQPERSLANVVAKYVRVCIPVLKSEIQYLSKGDGDLDTCIQKSAGVNEAS